MLNTRYASGNWANFEVESALQIPTDTQITGWHDYSKASGIVMGSVGDQDVTIGQLTSSDEKEEEVEVELSNL